MTECPHCGLSSNQTGRCPHCGNPIGGDETGPIRRYFLDLRTLILQPKEFFRHEPFEGGLTAPLTFALVTHWMAAAISYLWKGWADSNSLAFLKRFLAMTGNSNQIDVFTRNSQWIEAQHSLSSWIFGVGSVITDPFYTLFSIIFSSIFVFLGARILVSQPARAITYESAVRIVSYSLAASIFGVFPFMGSLIAGIYGIYIAMLGAQQAYRVGPGRALVIALFPKIFFIGVFFVLFVMAIALFGAAIFKMFAAGF